MPTCRIYHPREVARSWTFCTKDEVFTTLSALMKNKAGIWLNNLKGLYKKFNCGKLLKPKGFQMSVFYDYCYRNWNLHLRNIQWYFKMCEYSPEINSILYLMSPLFFTCLGQVQSICYLYLICGRQKRKVTQKTDYSHISKLTFLKSCFSKYCRLPKSWHTQQKFIIL